MSGATDSGMVKTMGVVMGALALLAVIIVIAARSLSAGMDDPNDPVLRQALASRIGPVGAVRTSADELPSAAADAGAGADAAAAPRSGEELANGTCAACHGTGLAGAPMMGDDAAWVDRIGKGLDALVTSAIDGIGTMPARGGSTYTDDEMRRAVQFMAGFEVDDVSSAAPAESEDVAEAAPEQTSEDDAEVAEAAADEAPVEPAADEAATEAAAETDVAESQAPAAEDVAQDTEQAASAETATEATETGTAATATAVAVVGQVPEGLTDNVRASVDNLCSTCHLAGVGGAPKMGDTAAWQERADKGMDVLTASVINGMGVMPPRGATTLSDEEMPMAIQYLMSK